MAQITEALIAEFESRLDSNLHINSTVGEERQLIEAWKEWNRRAEAVPKAYKQGQEAMRERAASKAAEEAGEYGTDSYGWYVRKSLSHQIEELEIEEPTK